MNTAKRNSPLVSVLMSCFNAEQHVDQAVNSLLKQSYQNVEYIFINDGSGDATLARLQEFDDERINIINHENIGIVASLNDAMQYCKGKYVARMDADDIAMPERIDKQVCFMENNIDVAACGGAINEFDETGFIKKTTKPLVHIDLIFSSLSRTPISNPSSMIRRSVLVENSLSYDPAYKYAQDVKMWADIVKVGKLANLPDVLVEYRKSSEQISTRSRDEQKRLAATVRAEVYQYIKANIATFETVSIKHAYQLFRYMLKHDDSMNTVEKSRFILSALASRK